MTTKHQSSLTVGVCLQLKQIIRDV